MLPGLALGILGLRQVRPRPAVRRASWLAIGASVAWAVIIVAIIAGSSGGSTVGCARYPTQVRQAYAKVMTDISTHAAGSVEAADMSVAATLANASAAAAGQIGTRTGLFTMAGDMAQARADVVAHRPVPVTLKQHLADDGAVPAGFCAS